MLQGLVNILSSAYVEIIILFFLLIAFVMHRRDPRLVVSGIRIVRTLLVVLIFFYFMFIWASTVQPTLRSISVFGMFLVNVFMLLQSDPGQIGTALPGRPGTDDQRAGKA